MEMLQHELLFPVCQGNQANADAVPVLQFFQLVGFRSCGFRTAFVVFQHIVRDAWCNVIVAGGGFQFVPDV